MATYGEQSTAEEVARDVDLAGKRVLITGVSSGLGVETARVMAARGARVIGAVRDVAAAEPVTQVVRDAAAHGGGLDLVELDLASLESVRRCVQSLITYGERLDIVIGNAGIMGGPRRSTAEGFEAQFGTNHLGHFLLINRLAPIINDGGRVVLLSSRGHRFADIDLDDPNFTRTDYAEFVAYGRSKTANILTAVEFDRRHKGRGVRATAVHPGAIPTNLGRNLTPDGVKMMPQIFKPDGSLMPGWKTIPQGAATSVWAAAVADAAEVGGRYCEDCHIAEVSDSTEPGPGVRSYAVDPERARQLWEKSEALVGERF